jgi:hypothetical protein
MSRNSQSLIVALAIVAVSVLPQRGHAQLSSVGTPEATGRAVAVEIRATRASNLPAAARLRERAADLRGPGDPEGVSDLLIAASARYYTGKPMYARELYVRAGERALADGDVEIAARSFMLAALVANEQRDAVALELKARGERLAGSPLLTEAQRRRILGLLVPPVHVAQKQP